MSTTENTAGASFQLAPDPVSSDPTEFWHCVQLYDNDVFLSEAMSRFVGTGFEQGEGLVVIATETHCNALEERLKARGLDVDAARARGQYLSLDAEETLAKIMVNGRPDRERFINVVGEAIERLAAAGTSPRVRAFGEMVALLWGAGQQEAALRLEELWDDLAKVRAFSLLCAYPMSGFSNVAQGGPFLRVCAGHSHVVPAEGYAGLASQDERLREIAQLQQKANSLESEIAERKKVEEALREREQEREQVLAREQAARRQAEEASRMKDEFLATVSHELRTPLNAMLGWARMLRTGRLDARSAARALETIERNAKAQAQLIGDLLDVSRIITGRLRLEVQPVELAAVIQAAADAVQPAADAREIRLQLVLNPKAGLVSGDPDRLQQVVWNLLSNAVKFTPQGGRVQVRLERVHSQVEITVSDTGRGISPGFLPHVFDRFRQADGSLTRMHGGLGLGLAIVRHLVELHGGTVEAHSPGEGQGATFTVRLPLMMVHETDPCPISPELSKSPTEGDNPAVSFPVSLAGLRVLAVDDEADVRELLFSVLGQCGAEVRTAASAAEALDSLESFRPDVLVSDIEMPGEDGYSLILKIRAMEAQQGGGIAAAALTAHARAADRLRALQSGYQIHVAKPVEPAELAAVVESLSKIGLVDRRDVKRP